jgi:hypothetical protein
MIKTINIKNRDVINDENYSQIIVDTNTSVIKIIGNTEQNALELKKLIITCRNRENMTDEDKRLYKFKVSHEKINNNYAVIIQNDLKSAV